MGRREMARRACPRSNDTPKNGVIFGWSSKLHTVPSRINFCINKHNGEGRIYAMNMAQGTTLSLSRYFDSSQVLRITLMASLGRRMILVTEFEVGI